MSVVYKRDAGIQTNTGSSILKVLVYFSIFQYPLSKEEIMKYMPPETGADAFEYALDHLVDDGIVFRIAEFYLLYNDGVLVQRRREGNQRAAQLLPKAMKIGRFLSGFPYVRGIGISGSLSKMYADEKTDIDFFIITKANRLWIARTFMHLFKKLTFLTGQQHYYCMNYYLGENALKLDEQNIYTAIETVTLLPVSGKAMQDFFAANDWVNKWFAEHNTDHSKETGKSGRSWLKRAIEWVLNNKAGNSLDNYLMRITTRRWQKKKQRGARNEEGKIMDLVTGKHFARSNPGRFSEKLLSIYNEKINELKRRHPGYFNSFSEA